MNQVRYTFNCEDHEGPILPCGKVIVLLLIGSVSFERSYRLFCRKVTAKNRDLSGDILFLVSDEAKVVQVIQHRTL
jgi:hypothetical protein